MHEQREYSPRSLAQNVVVQKQICADEGGRQLHRGGKAPSKQNYSYFLIETKY